MESIVRVRFAPSPTGYLHVGGLRTALYNYLFARHTNGKFILRIEDTDQSRKVEGAVENLIETLKWAGLEYDEGPDRDGGYGPYVQSQRLHLYRQYADQLVEQGDAYYCFCMPERLEELRKRQQEQKQTIAYDRACRNIPVVEARKRIENGEKHVIRMKIPLEGSLTFTDVIRGDVTFQYSVLDDQVLLKSDGFPTYHLAVVIDDHFMGITHVIRGEEWLSSVPKHLLLYRYFGWQPPVLAHLPLLLNPDRTKLSKRQGDVAVEDYRARGYLKEAIVNFVALLGWNPGDDRELFTMDELIREFTLERVGKSGAIFNIEKLNWLNQQHIRRKDTKELAHLLKPIVEMKGIPLKSDEYFCAVVDLLKEKLTVLNDFVEYSRYFFEEPSTYEQEGIAKHWDTDTAHRLTVLLDALSELDTFTKPELEATFKHVAEHFGVKVAKLIHPVRLALSGRQVGPGLYEMMEILGKTTVLKRIQRAIERIQVSPM
ncbi:MAG: glutamate--tRNA ligase [Bacteroidetes bacterium]|nr:glutamate--tRNA ligase [Bacteroidota bacterium]